MDLKQQLVFCKQCEKRAFNDLEIICSLTKRKPTFQHRCNDFSIDFKETQRMASKTKEIKTENSDSNYTIWIYLGVALIIIRLIMRLMSN